MRLPVRLVIALLICLVAIPTLIPATPAQAAETITLRPSSGNVGDEVYITGSGFDTYYDYWVYYETDDGWEEVLDRYDCTVDVDGYLRTDEFEIPESSKGDHEIRVCDDDDYGDWVAREDFEVKPKIEVDPDEGHMGMEIEVTGTGFASEETNIQILFDGEVVLATQLFTADDYGTWEGTFDVPQASEGSHDVSAKGNDTAEDEVEEADFTVEPGIGVSPEEGYVGEIITVMGSGFAYRESSIRVTYDGEQVGEIPRAESDGSWETSFPVPPSVRGRHKIDAYGSSTKASEIEDKNFEVTPKVTVQPLTGYVGTTITVTGGGFYAEETNIEVRYDYNGSYDTVGQNIAADGNGSWGPISYVVPASKYGAHKVDAKGYQSSYEDVIEATFTIGQESLPSPTLISPANGGRVGFVAKATPTFEWAAVPANNGIDHYDLQVASDGEFLNLVLNVPITPEPGAENVTYTPQEALEYGSYYWKVRAIDRAENVGVWNEPPYSFQAGLLPLWAFIAIIALIVVIIGVLVYVFAIRRRPYA